MGKGNLSRFTRFVYVPAVRDAAEDVAEGRTSPITRLLDYLVRSVLSKNAEIEQLKADVQRRYTELTNPSNIAELAGLSRDLGSLLRTFYPQTDVRVAWQPPAEISLPLLKADVFLKEDGFESRVSHMGHGLQRAFILSILQHLAVVVGRRGTDLKSTPSDAESDVNTDSSDIDATMDYAVSLIVAIEEPELYQHPSRQRHFARVLRTLVDQGHENYDGKIQVLYSTHSPHFLSLAHFNEIRRVRKCISEHAEIAEAKLVHADGERVAIGLWRAASAAGSQSDPFTFATLQPRLHIITPDVAEGFFADLVILVEGPTDHAAIVGVANYMGVNLEAENIAVIACGAKANLDRPKEIFSALEIPTYVVWDGDAKYRGVPQKERRAIATNRLLLGLHKQALMDWPSGVFQTFAVFEDNIESTTKNETGGDYYEEWFERNCHHFGFAGKNECKKNPVVLAAFFEAAHGEGRRATTLESIVTSALAIRGKPGEMEMRSIGDRHKPSAFIELVTASERANGGSAAATG